MDFSRCTPCLVVVCTVLGCQGAEDDASNRHALTELEAEAGSCSGFCGGPNREAGCWCDDLCDSYGDCCADKEAACAQPNNACVQNGGQCHVGLLSMCPDGGTPTADDCGQVPIEMTCCIPEAPCFIGGCSGELCAEEPLASPCIWPPIGGLPPPGSTCGRQADGTCGWTPPGPTCPDPNDPTVHYVANSNENPKVCEVLRFACDPGQTLFSNANECGCGCIDGPAPTCDDLICPEGERCELQEIVCIRAPCYPVPTCVPDSPSCGPRPSMP